MDFIDYVLSFYGVGGIYEHGWSDQQIVAACEVRMGMVEYAGDSIDREWRSEEHTSELQSQSTSRMPSSA